MDLVPRVSSVRRDAPLVGAAPVAALGLVAALAACDRAAPPAPPLAKVLVVPGKPMESLLYIKVAGKPDIAGSSDPCFRGDAARHSPEDLLVSSLSTCHMLWYLHLCAVNGICVVEYQDDAEGTLQEAKDGSGAFVNVLLKPTVTITESSSQTRAQELHVDAHRFCFIAKSVNFPVECAATIIAMGPK